jgi:hypothetical protein
LLPFGCFLGLIPGEFLGVAFLPQRGVHLSPFESVCSSFGHEFCGFDLVKYQQGATAGDCRSPNDKTTQTRNISPMMALSTTQYGDYYLAGQLRG